MSDMASTQLNLLSHQTFTFGSKSVTVFNVPKYIMQAPGYFSLVLNNGVPQLLQKRLFPVPTSYSDINSLPFLTSKAFIGSTT